MKVQVIGPNLNSRELWKDISCRKRAMGTKSLIFRACSPCNLIEISYDWIRSTAKPNRLKPSTSQPISPIPFQGTISLLDSVCTFVVLFEVVSVSGDNQPFWGCGTVTGCAKPHHSQYLCKCLGNYLFLYFYLRLFDGRACFSFKPKFIQMCRSESTTHRHGRRKPEHKWSITLLHQTRLLWYPNHWALSTIWSWKTTNLCYLYQVMRLRTLMM